ncbi:hypothetical protein MAR_035640, partial [Mya arenaria]
VIDDIIDLDHTYITYDGFHNSGEDVSTLQYYFRSNRHDNYKPLMRNPSDIQFFKDENNTIAVAVSNVNGTLNLKGMVNDEKGFRELEPLQGKGLPRNRYHVIKKRWTANILR